MNIGNAIRHLRKESGLSQIELAKKSAITQAALSMIENGTRPSEETLDKIATALEVPVSLIYVLSIEKSDVPAKKQSLYDHLFPIIQSMIVRIATDKDE